MKPVVVTCFKSELYDIIKVGKTYFIGKINKKTTGITVNKIIRSSDELYKPTQARLVEGKNAVSPVMTIESVISEKRKNATISAVVRQVKF